MLDRASGILRAGRCSLLDAQGLGRDVLVKLMKRALEGLKLALDALHALLDVGREALLCGVAMQDNEVLQSMCKPLPEKTRIGRLTLLLERASGILSSGSCSLLDTQGLGLDVVVELVKRALEGLKVTLDALHAFIDVGRDALLCCIAVQDNEVLQSMCKPLPEKTRCG